MKSNGLSRIRFTDTIQFLGSPLQPEDNLKTPKVVSLV